MSAARKAAFKEIDIARMVRGAIRGGLPVGSFKVTVENGALTLLPLDHGSALSEADDLEQRMQEAFGK